MLGKFKITLLVNTILANFPNAAKWLESLDRELK